LDINEENNNNEIIKEKIMKEKSQKTVLVVDDEKPIVDILVYNLKKEGYNTLEANDGEEAINIVVNKKPDLVLLDIMLPKMDGLTVCKKIRHNYNIPIIMLSAKDEEIDKILGLELGADDYITKPFSVRELIARVKANLRKSDAEYSKAVSEENSDKAHTPNEISVGDLYLDLDKFEVKVRGTVIDLTLREFEVLKYLAQQPGQVVTRETLLEKVWGYEYYGDIRTVDVTVRRIREKIELDTSSPKILITKRSVGYYIAS
jgi:two-component system response regulator VicR